MSTGFFPDYILMFDNFADFSLIFAEKKKEKQAAKNVRQKKTPQGFIFVIQT